MDRVNNDIAGALRHLFGALNQDAVFKVVAGTLLIAVGGAVAVLPAMIIGQAVDGIFKSVQNFEIWQAALPLACVLVAIGLVDIARKALFESVAVRLQADMQLYFAELLLRAPVDRVQRQPVGRVITLIDRGVAGVVRLMKLVFLEFGPAIATAGIAVAIVMNAHWMIAVVMAAVLSVNTGVTIRQIYSQRGVRIDLLARRAEFNSQVGELTQSLDSVRASGVVGAEQAEFGKTTEAIRSIEFKHHVAMMLFDALKGLSDAGGLVAVLIVALLLCATGSISAGDIVAITMLYQAAVVPLKMLHRVVDESHEAAIQIHQASNLADLGLDPGLAGTEGFVNFGTQSFAFEASNLSFAGSQEGEWLLRSVDYAVPLGTFDVIIGETGSGKSTLLRIILGLNAYYGGSAKVFGTEIKTAHKDRLSERICYVAQDPFLRSGDLRSNLTLGLHHQVSDEELAGAARLAGIELGEGAWSDGLHRKIAERGRGLSGGERQRIALARLFLSKAALFVLDEATSQLDEPMEEFVLGNLARMRSSKAIIMVAHRRTTLKWATRCFKLERGKLAVQFDASRAVA